ncbi:ASCH domain-containing protein [Streptomyces sp. NPDC093261]|uniref:ASCH domain-containing protein n=1 Tax=Streptomyces sp. NPDC093261 TaxID=3366037 RepID=UPI00380BE37F
MPETPRVLTVHAPWAYAIIHFSKSIENRTWETSYRGPLLIHCGQKVDDVGEFVLRKRGYPVPETYPAGHIIGRVQLVDCIFDSGRPWGEKGAWHWVLEDPEPAARPLATRGKQGLYFPPPGWESAFNEPRNT